MSIFVIRLPKETVVSVMYPDNPIARESVLRYVEALKSMFVRVAERRDTVSHVTSRLLESLPEWRAGRLEPR